MRYTTSTKKEGILDIIVKAYNESQSGYNNHLQDRYYLGRYMALADVMREIKVYEKEDYIEPVTVICYGSKRIWKSRQDAIDFYTNGILSCDGAEKDRYLKIYFDLISGKTICTDGEPERR